MSSIEKQAAHDKQESEDKAKKVEETGDTGLNPSNRVDLDAEDEADEFMLNYDPSKAYAGEEEDVDDYALIDANAGRDEEGNIIYQGSKRSVQVPPPSEFTSETPSSTEPEPKAETKVEVKEEEVKPKLTEAQIKAQEKRATKRYQHWGFTKGNTDSMVPAPPPPPPEESPSEKKKSRFSD